MKKFFWCMIAMGMAYAITYLIDYMTEEKLDIVTYLPLFFVAVYLIGITGYRTLPSTNGEPLTKDRVVGNIIIYMAEAFLITLTSVGAGKMVGELYVCNWTAAMLVLAAPSAYKVRHFIEEAQIEDSGE